MVKNATTEELKKRSFYAYIKYSMYSPLHHIIINNRKSCEVFDEWEMLKKEYLEARNEYTNHLRKLESEVKNE